MHIFKIPAEPAVWRLQLHEPEGTQDSTETRCGETFELLVEALDRFGNRWKIKLY